jgi:hypothetical protein
LQRELQAAREHRFLVSGRHPGKLAAHEAAKAAAKTAADKLAGARAAEARARTKIRELAHTHRSERGRAVMTGGPVAVYHVGDRRFTLRADAKEYVRQHGGEVKRVALNVEESKRMGAMSSARAVLEAAVKRRQELEKAEAAARKAAEAAKRPDIRAAIRYGENVPQEVRSTLGPRRAGQQLPNADIEAFLRSRGRDPMTVGHLPHRGEAIGARAYHRQQRPGVRGSEGKQTRTGSLYLKGAVRTTAQVLRDHHVSQATLLHRAEQNDRLIEEHGMLHPAVEKAKRGEALTAHEQKVVDAGGGFTPAEAMEIVDRARHDRGEHLVAVAMHPVVGKATEAVIRDNMRGPGGMDSLGQRLLNDRIVTEDSPLSQGKRRNVAIMSGHLVDNQLKHLQPAGPLKSAAQVLNRAFRFAVLPQPRWLTGNFVEPYIVRLTPHGSGVNIFGLGSTSRSTASCSSA